ncbi:MAG: GntR family transcriptional regulator, partial [Oceanihabitans sp.]
TNSFLDNRDLAVSQFETVDLIVSHPSDIGWNVIVNKVHLGLIYNDNVFQDISVGDKLQGVVKKIRPGNKLDITLGKIGYRNIEPNAETIMQYLEDNSGFLNLTDKSNPEAIKDRLQMSKKSFKKAVGNLYKQKLITIKTDGIYKI